MTTTPAVRVEGVAKEYSLGSRGGAGETFYDLLSEALRAPFRRRREATSKHSAERFWALSDVSFDLAPGEVLGIIGRNGAGKSTLLKILTRITDPTRGRIEIRGRVASLLEVGTGFHPELSGRENIFLNGAILGMSRQEIARKFDEIVAFAEIEQFLDTPVKRYSSGMYVRLAFAVAAHLEPDVLVVDEVLAVGDAEFQERCLGKMKAVKSSGRTVVFVSHNMAAISSLCTTGILLNHGRVSVRGAMEEVVHHYLSSASMANGGAADLREHPFRRPGARPLLAAITLRNARGEAAGAHRCGEPLMIDLTLTPSAMLDDPQFGIGVDDALGSRVFSLATYLSPPSLGALNGGSTVRCRIDSIILPPGVYTLSLSAGNRREVLIDALDHAVAFEVAPADFYGAGILPTRALGQVLVQSNWSALDTG